MTDILNAILAINPKAEVTVEDENWDTIIWHNIEPLEKSVVLAKKVELETAYNDNAYQRSRKVEYPSIVDQLDDLYHNGIDGWKTTIKTIKDKYPIG